MQMPKILCNFALHKSEHMIRYIMTAILALTGVLCASAQSLACADGLMRWEGAMSGGLNNDGYEVDFQAAYFPLPYVGIKASLGFAGEIEELGDWGREEWETGHEYAIRFKFNPSLVVRTPRLIHWKSQDAGFFLFTEPGIVLSPGASGSRNARWFSWDVKTGINFQIDRYIVTLGYGISDFSLYSGAPVNHNGLPKNTNYITHTVFIGGAYKF